MNVTRLQELYSRAMASQGQPAGGCVSPEDLLALVRQEAAEERRLQVLDHVMSCQACHREFELLRALEAAGEETRPRASVPGLRWRFTPLALAASLLLAIGVGLAVRSRLDTRDVVRGSGGVTLFTPPLEVAPGQPVTFTWSSIAGARRYRLEILDRQGTTVLTQLTADTSLIVPAGQFQPASDYRWWVRDATPGAELGSTLRPLRVRSK